MELGRRELIIGGAALAATSSGCLAQKPERKLGYAIVGLGGYGLRIIIPQFANCEQSRLAAVVSGDPERRRGWLRSTACRREASIPTIISIRSATIRT